VSILIVLFGQENETDGTLRMPAKARAEKAAELFRELAPGNETVILPTGAFGTHFNTSDLPHFHYLTEELIRLGVPRENILPGAASSNTVQDATEAWYRFKNGGHHRLIAVTSDYHAERVAFLLGRLSASDDADIEVVPAPTPSDYNGIDRSLEPEKIERLRREWVDVPSRTRDGRLPEGLPVVYQDAGREHQHYDTLSLAVVSALFIVNAFAFSIIPGRGGWFYTIVLLILTAAIDLMLWSLYNRMADAARTARRVLNRIEIEHRLPGYSTNWRTEGKRWYELPPWRWSMKDLVTALAIALFVTLAVVAFAAVGEPEISTTPRASTPTAANVTVSPTPIGSANGNAIDRFANAVMGSQNIANSNVNTNDRRRR
jgi:hypothetical protein